MRKFLVSLLVIGAASLSASAQAPLHGLKTGYVAAVYTGEVLPGHGQFQAASKQGGGGRGEGGAGRFDV